MDVKKLIEAIKTAEQELDDLYTMSEEAACFHLNTDSKEEAIEILSEHLASLYDEYDKPEFKEEVEVDEGVDLSFNSLAEYYRMRL